MTFVATITTLLIITVLGGCWTVRALRPAAQAATATVTGVALLGIALAMPAAAKPGFSCRDVRVPVALHPGQARTDRVWGRLCEPARPRPATVQLLIHGITYTHTYWDFPLQPDRYSYVRHLTQVGYATLAIDRIGHGRSSHIPSSTLDLAVNVYVAHQVVQALKTGIVGRYTRVETVGHSYGSLVAMAEAAEYHDVAATILTGILHHISPARVAMVTAALWPADLDRRFSSLDPGYLTTRPGSRVIFHATDTDPAVIARDEATKDTVSARELATFPIPLLDGSARRIQVPVLLIIGQDDRLFCGPDASDCSTSAVVQAEEAPYFAPGHLTSYVLPHAGHDINLAPDANRWYQTALRWSDHLFRSGTPHSTGTSTFTDTRGPGLGCPSEGAQIVCARGRDASTR